ncbi:hypothetical protein NEUTE1DRAFT_102980 [Neurospora tetrasperma FGSC 2508]|uniref:Uncharacterized protein n=1 Tax=Neurospora tetrasperma (strain FGSC 2508 / ATCC MYA-4615 / P0657) TaxID=510951 RepID=F8MU88_NEUT8|nr:uncharacterized protein NEUTE1DRAFT_102980 [Neurospora tetrasperma FGSC 2508]EGO55570.1 hypothetical protein NEUTE1DRAFT_102980 [Neurospora tetrasperma FGSC 2508]
MIKLSGCQCPGAFIETQGPAPSTLRVEPAGKQEYQMDNQVHVDAGTKCNKESPAGSSAHVVIVGGAHSESSNASRSPSGTPSPAGFSSLTVG